MNANNELSKFYDALLSVPGMNETVKIDLKITRKNVLLLTHVIHRGLSAKAEVGGLPEIASKESLQEIISITEDCLQKAGLVELNEKLGKIEK